jgi:hypothetical protein
MRREQAPASPSRLDVWTDGGADRVGQELRDGIASFYDESSAIWEDVWGEHMHHGFYPTGSERDHKKAQVSSHDTRPTAVGPWSPG